MKQLLIALLACLPLMAMAQNTWELPQDQQQQADAKKATVSVKNKSIEDPKYLAGAVPEVDGRVVFTLDKDVPGMSADDIYQKVYDVMDAITKEDNQLETSKIAAVNKGEHTIAGRYKEWLVFQSNFISLDRTVFNYTLIAQSQDGHIHVTMERMSYAYEKDRTDIRTGMEARAEEWITDKMALNKKQTKLAKYSGKFRRKTIDRKDYIFGQICGALGLKY